MTDEEYQWNLKSVQDQNSNLNLTIEQAKLIHDYEKDTDELSAKSFLSQWEKWDYELFIFTKILDSDQLAIYAEAVKADIENYKHSLIKQDSDSIQEIERNKEMIKYYEEKFLPELYKEPMLFTFGWLSSEMQKIQFLRAEYKVYLNHSKEEILLDHFRHYRTYMPYGLEASLLRHKLSHLWPNYSSFKESMDQPTKAVAEYLNQKLKYFGDQHEDFIKSHLRSLMAFKEATLKKHHGDPTGWHTVVRKLIVEDEKENTIMSVLLHDRNK